MREIQTVGVLGRSQDRAEEFCRRVRVELGISFNSATTVEDLVCDADIICTVTGSREPVLRGAWVRPGTHINLVGSGVAGPVEVDTHLVVRSRFVADSREGVLRQGTDFLRAKEAGAIDDAHIIAEIGQVLAGEIVGRRSDAEITVYLHLVTWCRISQAHGRFAAKHRSGCSISFRAVGNVDLPRTIGIYRPQATLLDGRSDGKNESTTAEATHIQWFKRAGDN